MDNAVPRFTSIDPMAEKYYSISPYAYCNNNPLKYIDPDGKQVGEPFPSIFASPAALQATKVRQDTGWQGDTTWDAFTRGVKTVAAITVSASIKASVFFSVEGSVGITLITSGKNAGQVQNYANGSFGMDKDVSISTSATVEAIVPNNAEKFNGQDLEGSSSKTSIEIPVKKILNGTGNISVVGSHAKSETNNAGKINNYGVGVSAGIGMKKIFGGFLDKFNVSKQETETKGFKTNSYQKK